MRQNGEKEELRLRGEVLRSFMVVSWGLIPPEPPASPMPRHHGNAYTLDCEMFKNYKTNKTSRKKCIFGSSWKR
jgi:hypothetical protein